MAPVEAAVEAIFEAALDPKNILNSGRASVSSQQLAFSSQGLAVRDQEIGVR